MPQKPGKFGHDPRETIVSIIPAIAAGVINLILIVIASYLLASDSNGNDKTLMIVYGVGGILFYAIYYLTYNAYSNSQAYVWGTAVSAAIALGFLTYITPRELNYLIYSLVLIASLSSSIISERGAAYLLIGVFTLINLQQQIVNDVPVNEWIIHAGFAIAALFAVETVQQLKMVSKKQVERLETINEISKQIVSTIETEQLISLLDAALKNALDADTYYIGIQKGDKLHMQLFYDDGEYFSDVVVDTEGTISGWVVNNKKSLFLPDLRKDIKLEGVTLKLLGKPKTSLSWMGVPMQGSHVNGLIAIASYRPNAFNRSDFELLSTITQRAALALDNAHHHALVEEQARLDSLTRVYNHSYFIKTLHEQAETCLALKQPLSLIMMDIDYFKQYNDSFGHLVGDEILVSLCQVIREHIKQGDAVGRWGGEEFAISLPNATKEQAHNVAERIRETLANFKISNTSVPPITVPTISMGIAEFPAETKDVNKLIDLADKRLYIAKERGRDQIEPAF
jgi:diguanylate cyclase (GGDEF)-like protein